MTKSGQPQPVIMWEIGTDQAVAARRFYSAVFGWRTHLVPPGGYTRVASGGAAGLGGGIADTQGGFPDYVTLYVEVDDVAASLERAAGCSGEKLMGPFEPAPALTVGFVRDPDGTMIGLMHVRAPLEIPTGFLEGEVAHPVRRFEIGSLDLAAGARFYGALFGWTIRENPGGTGALDVAFPDNVQVSGSLCPIGEGESPYARFLVSAADPAPLIDRILSWGGTVLRKPEFGVWDDRPILFADPAGHVVGICPA